MEYQSFLYDFLYVLLTGLGSILIAYLIKRTKQSLNTDDLEAIQTFAKLAVEYAQQKYADCSGEERYNYALEWLVGKAAGLNLNITKEDLKVLIESSVKELKIKLGENWKEM